MNKTNEKLLAAGSFLLVLLIWWFITSHGFVPDYFLPAPVVVFGAIINLFVSHGFLSDVIITIMRITIGFIIATILAIPVGFAIGLNRKASAFLEPMIDFIRYTPITAFIPLFILWFGIGEGEKIIVIVSSVFFQLVLLVANSVAATPKKYVDSARTLGATTDQIITTVVLPNALPRIVDDLRISIGWAWAVVTLAEIVGSTSGIGYVIIQSQRLLQTANVMAAIIVIGVLGLATDAAFRWVYAASFPWAPRINDVARN